GLPRMHVDRPQQYVLLRPVQRERQDGRMELLVEQLVVQRVLIELDVHRLRLAAVENPGNLPPVAQAAARTPSLHLACLRYHFDCHVASKCIEQEGVPLAQLTAPATRRRIKKPYSMNSDETESSLLMRRIVSASSPATESTRIFLHA